ncbi:MAG TPA: four helix bundle protein [Candidatus Nanoarchaeia archaeon]|nr:four helix bundle protein [Candidatus Nanoarchaeia archaeon]
MARMYKNIEIWGLSYNFVLDMYALTEKFPESERNNLTSQMRRAATSIPLNIAEGSSRKSTKEFLNFLNYAYGSAKELDVLLSLSKDLKFVNKEEYDVAYKKLDKLMAKLYAFLQNIEKRLGNKKKFNFFQKFEEVKQYKSDLN